MEKNLDHLDKEETYVYWKICKCLYYIGRPLTLEAEDAPSLH
jgi:hypothetical protein